MVNAKLRKITIELPPLFILDLPKKKSINLIKELKVRTTKCK